jgi:hypothetical protein
MAAARQGLCNRCTYGHTPRLTGPQTQNFFKKKFFFLAISPASPHFTACTVLIKFKAIIFLSRSTPSRV